MNNMETKSKPDTELGDLRYYAKNKQERQFLEIIRVLPADRHAFMLETMELCRCLTPSKKKEIKDYLLFSLTTSARTRALRRGPSRAKQNVKGGV